MIKPWLILLGLSGAVASGLIWRHQSLATLQQEVFSLRKLHRDAAEPAVRKPQPAEADAAVEQIWSELATVARLRTELDAIRQRVTATGRVQAVGKVGADAKPRHSLRDGPVKTADWRNAGRETPEAAIETALWSAAGGDTDSLAETLVLEAGAKAKVDALFAGLPAELRSQFATPEKFVAFMTVRDVPEGTAAILGIYPMPAGAKLTVRLTDTAGLPRVVALSLASGGAKWRLVVPETAIDRYTAFLRGEAR